MSAGTQPGLVEAIQIDLKLMHETWMEMIYPRQRDADHTVLGKWKPTTTGQTILYRLWAAVGVPVVGVVYPLVLLGYFVRFQTRRINVAAVRLGFVGVVLLFVVLWGALAGLAYFEFSHLFDSGGATAIVAASGVAVVSAAISFFFHRIGGRGTTVLLAYPFAVTAIFLPPVVAALFSTAVANVVLERSDSLARWVVFEGPDPFGVIDWLVENFERDEYAHVIIWFSASFPVGWALGTFVTLADLVRPSGE